MPQKLARQIQICKLLDNFHVNPESGTAVIPDQGWEQDSTRSLFACFSTDTENVKTSWIRFSIVCFVPKLAKLVVTAQYQQICL